jgi:5'-methylthioadenosine phosphorylase
MPIHFACIAGQEIRRLRDGGRLEGKQIGRRSTPFGLSGEIFHADLSGHPFYLLERQGPGLAKTAPRNINNRANLYALRDLDVTAVVGWGPAAAITHSFAKGDLVLVSDLIDLTTQRDQTFFEGSPLGYLRQFPVFCERLRQTLPDVLERIGLAYQTEAIAAVKEGPRHETPAEVRMLNGLGAEIVTHTLAPEMFLARELQMCYAGICYIADYAETGSRYQPFEVAGLFDNHIRLTQGPEGQDVDASMDQVIRRLARRIAEMDNWQCDCGQAMASKIQKYDLDHDWRAWFSAGDDSR